MKKGQFLLVNGPKRGSSTNRAVEPALGAGVMHSHCNMVIWMLCGTQAPVKNVQWKRAMTRKPGRHENQGVHPSFCTPFHANSSLPSEATRFPVYGASGKAAKPLPLELQYIIGCIPLVVWYNAHCESAHAPVVFRCAALVCGWNQTARAHPKAPFVHTSMSGREQKHPVQRAKQRKPMRRNGKIARRPAAIRTELKHRIHDSALQVSTSQYK